MSDKIKGVKIRYENNQLSNEIPIGALSQNVDYNDENVKTVLDKLDFIDRIQTGAGEKSLILGNGSLADGNYSLAVGNATQALTVGSYAEGYLTVSDRRYSHAEGRQTYAHGHDSHAEGRQTQANGQHSHAEGYQTVASYNSCHAEGYQTTSSGSGSSHAEGHGTQASGQASHAEGFETIASGKYSHAGGYGAQARGDADTAFGWKTIAQGAGNPQVAQGIGKSQFVFGQFNKPASELTQTTDYLEIVGNGSSITRRSNARTLDMQGNEWLAGTLKVGGSNYDDEQAVAVATGAVYKGDRTDSVILNNQNNTASGKNSTAFGTSFIYGKTIYLSASEANAVKFSYTGAVLNEYDLALIELGAGRIFASMDEAYYHPQKNSKIINIDIENQIITLNQSLYKYSFFNKLHYLTFANTAIGESSFVHGEENVSYGNNSHAEGRWSCAVGQGSHAEGQQTRAIGKVSHAEGIGTIANHRSQKVFGEHNIPDGNFTGINEKGYYIEIAGNGTSNERSNARTLDWDGNEWLAGTLKIGGSDYNDSNAQQVATKQYVTEKIENAVINQSEIALDSTLTKENQAAQAKAVGTKFNEITNTLNGIPTNLSTTLNNYIQKPGTNGNNGDILQNNSNGTTSWVKPLKVGTTTGSAADGKLVNDFINNINNNYSTTSVLDGRYIQKPNSNVQSGLVLMSNGSNSIKWQSMSLPNITINSQTMTVQNAIQELSENQNGYIQKPLTNSNGENGQILSTNGDGTTNWINKSFVNKPNNNGISGQVLKTNGDGTTSWIEPLNLKDLYNLQNRKFLFIGDSYCQGWCPSGTQDNNPGWAYYCAESLGLHRTQVFTSAGQINSIYTKPVREWISRSAGTYNENTNNRDNETVDDDYEIICNDGAKFSLANTKATFEDLLIDAYARKYDGQHFTDIVVCGGYNERNNTYENIISGIESFVNKAKELQPNANIYIGHVGYNKKGSGDRAPENLTENSYHYEDVREHIKNVSLPAYKTCNQYGAIYLSNIEFILDDSGLNSNDGIHPNANGNKKLGKAIASAILNNAISFPYNQESLDRLNRRKFLILGDCYCQGWTSSYSVDGKNYPGWYTYFNKYISTFRTSSGTSIYPVNNRPTNSPNGETEMKLNRVDEYPNDGYKVTCYGGARFQDRKDANASWNFMTFKELLKDAYKNKFVGMEFTDIIVCGGVQDGVMYVNEDFDTESEKQAIKERIQSDIQDFINIAKIYYPKVKIFIGFIGQNAVKDKDSTQQKAGNVTTNLLNDGGAVRQAYKSCEDYGAIYIDGIENCFTWSDIIGPSDANTNTWRQSIQIPNNKLELIAKTVANFVKTH